MRKEFLFRFGGGLVIVSALFLSGFGIGPNIVSRYFIHTLIPYSEKIFTLFAMAGFFLASLSPLAFITLYLKQSYKSGIVGLAGFIFVFFHNIYSICNRFFVAFIAPNLGEMSLTETSQFIFSQPFVVLVVFSLIFIAGFILFGISLIRSGVFPSLPAILFTAGMPAAMAGFLLPGILRALGTLAATVGLVWLGLFLIAGKSERGESPESTASFRQE